MPSFEKETIFARGHLNILATHKSTLEITKQSQLSKTGDCIIATSADKALTDLSSGFKKNLCKDEAKITISIQAGRISETINAFGSSKITLTHPSDMVVRKSNYVCSRTLAIRADKAACDLPRRFVEQLKDPHQIVRIILTAKI